MKDLLSKSDIPGRLKEIAQVAGAMTKHIVNLMAVFLLQTLVIPLVLGWILLRGVGVMLQVRQRPVP